MSKVLSRTLLLVLILGYSMTINKNLTRYKPGYWSNNINQAPVVVAMNSFNTIRPLEDSEYEPQFLLNEEITQAWITGGILTLTAISFYKNLL